MTGPSIPPIQPGTQRPQAPAQPVQIVTLPEGLQNNARALRLEGEVVGQNRNGSTRVNTAEGNIDILIKGRQPQNGQRIELEIPAGSTPKQASMRALPAAPAQNTQPASHPQPPPTQTTPPQAQTQPQDTQAPVTRPAPSSGTAQTSTTPATSAPVQTQAPLPPLNPGQVIKLTPAPADMVMDAAEPAEQKPVPPQAGEKQTALMTPISKPAAQMSSAHTPQQAGIYTPGPRTAMQTAAKNFFTQIAQAVKTVLPLPGTGLIQTAPSPANAPATQGMTPEPFIQPAAKLIYTPQAAPLFAKITAITSPTGQTMFAPPTMDAPDLMPTMQTTGGTRQAVIQPAAQPFTAPVIGNTPDGRAIIPLTMNANGTSAPFIIQAQATLPQGAQVTLVPQLQPQASGAASMMQAMPGMPSQAGVTPMQPAMIQTAAPLPAAWRPLLPLMQPSSVWPVMDDIFQSFYQATPQAAQILGRIIPSPTSPQTFGAAVLLFAAAMKSGDMQSWLGDKKTGVIQKLGRDQLLSRLSGESATLPQNADSAPMDWKSYPIPLLWHNQISKVIFHVRKEPSEDERENSEGGTRFVMDLSLTRMGNVQIDGMVRGNRLDLILRTEMPISLSMQDAMRSAYAKALDGTDVYGDIGFQGDAASWVHVLAQGNTMAASA